MPGEISRSNPGPSDDAPLVPTWTPHRHEGPDQAVAPWPKSSWLQRRFRRLVIGAVVSGMVLSGVTAAVLRSRRKP